MANADIVIEPDKGGWFADRGMMRARKNKNSFVDSLRIFRPLANAGDTIASEAHLLTKNTDKLAELQQQQRAHKELSKSSGLSKDVKWMAHNNALRIQIAKLQQEIKSGQDFLAKAKKTWAYVNTEDALQRNRGRNEIRQLQIDTAIDNSSPPNNRKYQSSSSVSTKAAGPGTHAVYQYHKDHRDVQAVNPATFTRMLEEQKQKETEAIEAIQQANQLKSSEADKLNSLDALQHQANAMEEQLNAKMKDNVDMKRNTEANPESGNAGERIKNAQAAEKKLKTNLQNFRDTTLSQAREELTRTQTELKRMNVVVAELKKEGYPQVPPPITPAVKLAQRVQQLPHLAAQNTAQTTGQMQHQPGQMNPDLVQLALASNFGFSNSLQSPNMLQTTVGKAPQGVHSSVSMPLQPMPAHTPHMPKEEQNDSSMEHLPALDQPHMHDLSQKTHEIDEEEHLEDELRQLRNHLELMFSRENVINYFRPAQDQKQHLEEALNEKINELASSLTRKYTGPPDPTQKKSQDLEEDIQVLVHEQKKLPSAAQVTQRRAELLRVYEELGKIIAQTASKSDSQKDLTTSKKQKKAGKEK